MLVIITECKLIIIYEKSARFISQNSIILFLWRVFRYRLMVKLRFHQIRNWYFLLFHVLLSIKIFHGHFRGNKIRVIV